MSWNLFSLVLASTTGWAVLAIGFLPVAVLRQRRLEPLKAAGAWAVVAATAPSAVYHWYLIFALICLIAWTKLDRPAGKVVLAVAAALGLSLGIVFPLEALPGFLASENPIALASLYLGGAVTGLAYALYIVARTPDPGRTPKGFAQALLIAMVLWIALLGAGPHWLDHTFRSIALPVHDTVISSIASVMLVNVWAPLIPAAGLAFLAFSALSTAQRLNALRKTSRVAGFAAILALLTSLLAQFVLR
jgi:hypothetical protein